MQRIRVTYVINDILVGGAQSTVLALARGLDRNRFDPKVYYFNEYPRERANLSAQFSEARVPVRYIGTGGKTSIPRATLSLWKRLRQDGSGVVHTHLVDATIAGVIASKLTGRMRVIVHEHQTHQLYSPKVRVAYWFLRPFADLTLCFSPVIEKELFGSVSVLSVPPSKINRRSYSIYNGIDIERADHVRQTINRKQKRAELGIPEDAFVITSVARLIDWKGQRTLLEAFGLIADKLSWAHLCLVGEGPLREELAARAITLGVSQRVHLLGARNDVYEILAASDAGSLALTYGNGMQGESVGIAGFEVMGLGLPLIASAYRSASLPVSDKENIVLVPPGDAPALAQALVMLAENPEERVRIGTQAAAHARQLMDWRVLVPLYERLYTLLIP